MPARSKPVDEQGGSSQRAQRARAVAHAEIDAHEVLADDVVVKKRRKIMLMQKLLQKLLDLQHWTAKQHGIGFKNGAGAK